jgi:hypothetical protein
MTAYDDGIFAGIHESGIAALLIPARAARFRATIGSPRGRAKIRGRLAHHAKDLDGRWATKLASSVGVLEIQELLQAYGSPARCYVLSENPETDGRFVDLGRAIDDAVTADDATLISCIPGTLGLFVDEAPGGQWLLRRRSQLPVKRS